MKRLYVELKFYDDGNYAILGFCTNEADAISNCQPGNEVHEFAYGRKVKIG